MADIASSAQQCAFQTLAFSTLGTDSTWDSRLAEYLRTDALQRADCAFGAVAKANETNASAHIRVEYQYGPHWRNDPRARAVVQASDDTSRAADDQWTAQYARPFWQAARELVNTPAPTLAAALFKAQVIGLDEVWNDGEMQRDCMEIVREDMVRLSEPGVASAVSSAFQQYQQKHEELAALDGADDVAEKALWQTIDAADKEMQETAASSLVDIASKLFLAIIHSEADHEVEQACLRRDVDWLEAQGGALDWNLRHIVSALRDLKTMEV